MGRNALVAVLLAMGCADQPCDAFPDETCLALEVRGPGLTIDQIALHALSGFVLSDGRSPPLRGARRALPLVVPVVPGGRFAGEVQLQVRGLVAGALVGSDVVHSTVAAGQHLDLIAELGGAHASDLAGIDLAPPPGDLATETGADLATTTGVDLAGSDLARVRPPPGPTVTWSEEAIPFNDRSLQAVAASGVDDVWAVDSGHGIFHRGANGLWKVDFTPGTGDSFDSIWANAPDDIYASGEHLDVNLDSTAILFHSTGGGSWLAQTVPAGNGFGISNVMGSARDDVWAPLGGVGVLHSTGNGTWTPQPLQALASSLWATARDDIWLATDEPAVFHSTGNGVWSKQTAGLASVSHIAGVWASAPDDVYLAAFLTSGGPTADGAILHSTGNGSWLVQKTTLATALTAIHGSGPTDIYAVGSDGTVLHSVGDGVWVIQPTGVSVTLVTVFAPAPGQAWAAGSEQLGCPSNCTFHTVMIHGH